MNEIELRAGRAVCSQAERRGGVVWHIFHYTDL